MAWLPWLQAISEKGDRVFRFEIAPEHAALMPQAGALVTGERCVTGGQVAVWNPGIFAKKKTGRVFCQS